MGIFEGVAELGGERAENRVEERHDVCLRVGNVGLRIEVEHLKLTPYM